MELKQIKGFTKYFVGSDGYMYKDCGGTRGLKRLKGMTNSSGYKQIVMVENGHKERYLIHRLVATYFIPNPDNKPYVDHINTIIQDNRVENLRWATPKENSNNPLSVTHYTCANRKRNEYSIICKKDGIEIRFDVQYVAARYFKCTTDIILDAANTNTQLYGFQVFKEKVGEKLAS